MRKYWTSDYAANKNREGIVYLFADSELEITLEDYIRANPEKTEQDFAELKALSDEMYHEQELDETGYGKRARNLDWLKESEEFATPAPDTQLIERCDFNQAMNAAKQLLKSGELTEVQERRFILHFFKGRSYRQIAAEESVHFTSVQESIEAAVKKLKRNF